MKHSLETIARAALHIQRRDNAGLREACKLACQRFDQKPENALIEQVQNEALRLSTPKADSPLFSAPSASSIAEARRQLEKSGGRWYSQN